MGLANAMKKAAERHAKIAKALIDGSDETLEINVRAARSSASGASLFGDLSTSPATPTAKGPFKCLWFDSNSIPSDNARLVNLVGRYPKATCFAQVKLSDIIVTEGDTHTETWLDSALEVVHRGQKFEVLAYDRHGLANIAPYLVTIVLAGETHRNA
jgi:hypothetical protein